MSTSVFICNGIVRSGSTWSFNVCRQIGQIIAGRSGVPHASAYLSPQQLDTHMMSIASKVPSVTVIKAHSIGRAAVAALRSNQAKAVCTFRDPRDCVASDLSFLRCNIPTAVERMLGNLTLFNVYLSIPNTLFVRYDQMMSDPAGQVVRIAEHMGTQLTPVQIQQVVYNNSIEQNQKICQSLRNRPITSVSIVEDHRVDPTTQLHDNHISSGKNGRWRTDLSPEQGAYLTETFKPWLLKLGYETESSIRQQLAGVPADRAAFANGQTIRVGAASSPFGTLAIL